jgi:Rps23 Pro-64 3,4-dihydroxylase Tpa1-like proline 4-hydroxylase
MGKGDAMTGAPGVLGVFDNPSYAKLALESAKIYRSAEPFPHIALDNFLDVGVAQSLAQAFPKPDDSSVEWILRDNGYNLKRYQHDETKLPALIRQVLREFNSRQFILFLETLTGIENLIPDPYFIGGGAHLSARGDFLKVHSDFNWHHKLLAHRRVNALFYLSPTWQEEWGGALELWDEGMTRPCKSYFPIFNRLLVFNTTEVSHHGHPHPLNTPDGVFRHTLNLYYYTTRTTDEIKEPHFTLYKTDASPFARELSERYRATPDKI